MSVDDDLTRWKYLSDQAKEGLLTLDPEAATAYASACQTLISGIAEAKNQIRYASKIGGLGDFAWANELRDGLKGVISGPENSVQDTLDKYIQVAQLMSDTVNAAVGKLMGQDVNTQDAIRSAGKG